MKSLAHYRYMLTKWAPYFAIKCQYKTYSKLIITHSSLTVYTHSELFTCFQNSRHSRLISVNMFHYLLICVQLFLIKTTTAIVLNSLMKYLLPRGNILKSLMLHEQRYLHIILIASLTLLSLYIHLDF